MTDPPIARFLVNREAFDIPVPERTPAVIPSLCNSGYRDYPLHRRGSWPFRPELLIALGVKSVTSLVAQTNEVDAARTMQRFYGANGIDHRIWVLSDSPSHVLAAKDCITTADDRPSYIHCRDGANRTGIVAALANLYSYAKENQVPAREAELVGQLTTSLAYGFDHTRRTQVVAMQDALSAAIREGWLKV